MIGVITQILDAGEHHRLQNPHFSGWICLYLQEANTCCALVVQ